MATKFFFFFLLKDCAKKLELRSFNLIGMCTQGGEHSPKSEQRRRMGGGGVGKENTKS